MDKDYEVFLPQMNKDGSGNQRRYNDAFARQKSLVEQHQRRKSRASATSGSHGGFGERSKQRLSVLASPADPTSNKQDKSSERSA